jgi:hypothetical protein
MIRVDCVQGSAEWHRLRLGHPTASGAAKIVTPKRLELSAQRADYLDQLLAEWFSGEPQTEFLGTYWTERGQHLEGDALAAYDLLRDGPTPESVGVVFRDESRTASCSPDWWLAPHNGVEVKCPAFKTQVSYLRLGIVPPAYVPQIQFSIWVCGADFWDFLSYHPRLPAVLRRVEPDQKWQDAFSAHVPVFLDELSEARQFLLQSGVQPVGVA